MDVLADRRQLKDAQLVESNKHVVLDLRDRVVGQIEQVKIRQITEGVLLEQPDRVGVEVETA